MRMTFMQTIRENVFDEKNIEERIKSELVPNIGDYVIVGDIDYNKYNDIVIKVKSREMF